jgi:hypothetical protein
MAATLDDKLRTVANRLSQMHMKHELYDLIADLEGIYQTPINIGWKNSVLLD